MTDATFSGTYSDIKLIRSRKVAVVCVEIPIEAATAFVAAFGMPDPAEETWVALARMKVEPEKPTTVVKRKFEDLPLPQQAALTCQREAFQRFIAEQGYGLDMSESGAASFVRAHCDVKSRSELATDDDAGISWMCLYRDFNLWLEEPACTR